MWRTNFDIVIEIIFNLTVGYQILIMTVITRHIRHVKDKYSEDGKICQYRILRKGSLLLLDLYDEEFSAILDKFSILPGPF